MIRRLGPLLLHRQDNTKKITKSHLHNVIDTDEVVLDAEFELELDKGQ